MNSASGVVREKVDELFASSLSKYDRDELSTLIYYPRGRSSPWYPGTRRRRRWRSGTASAFTALSTCAAWSPPSIPAPRSCKALPREYSYIIDELLNSNYRFHNKREYYENIISTIIDIDRAGDFVVAVCQLIKRMVVDHLHIVGDVFDRGPRADVIMDYLIDHHSVDIQWGNHDVLWMGAATGSRTW